ncbi:YbbC/YhhH family protein [Hymenobacter monticola]|uniref:YbbC/YhhH family protein n=1 Tax=Hymenobacter monticola TaxID=1705399 RepID=A0ABY4B8M6_9BACT|nr:MULTISPECIES: YbbC/YhhH family protein [Hymenobacter]UOE35527.1 YbbC/YhhH family protein [Hymenobacter monticola]UOQ97826.1 YbbC/YhhH family protein [Hymenobacter sp. 5317J-9]
MDLFTNIRKVAGWQLVSALLIAGCNAGPREENQASKPAYDPNAGFVPTADVAKKIAEAVWAPIYGQEHIEEEKPFRAVLTNNEVWVVQGSLPKQYALGGTAYIEINKRDGRILKVIHGK